MKYVALLLIVLSSGYSFAEDIANAGTCLIDSENCTPSGDVGSAAPIEQAGNKTNSKK